MSDTDIWVFDPDICKFGKEELIRTCNKWHLSIQIHRHLTFQNRITITRIIKENVV